MTVIINDFEVVTEPPQGERPASEPSDEGTTRPSPASTAGDIERILQYLAERMARIAD